MLTIHREAEENRPSRISSSVIKSRLSTMTKGGDVSNDESEDTNQVMCMLRELNLRGDVGREVPWEHR